ncbi:MAG: hypothetical protein R3B70_44485 [Polyangiaceae bacterium]
MDVLIPIPTRRTVVTARRELRVPFHCKHCGFTSTARVVGTGTAATHSTLAFLPAPTASDADLRRASGQAFAEGQELLALVPCPKCGQRDPVKMAAHLRVGRILQGIVGALSLGLVALVWSQADNPAVPVLCAVPGALAVFLTGYLHRLRTETPQHRVTFLSEEDLAAEEAARKAKKQASKKAAARAAAVEAEAAERAPRRRKRARRPADD